MDIKRSQFLATFLRLWPALVAVIILTVLLALLRLEYAVLGVALLIVLIAIEAARTTERGSVYTDLFEDVISEMDDAISEAVVSNPFPLCMIDRKGWIVWMDAAFESMFEPEKNPMGINIQDLTGLKIQEMTNEDLKNRIVTISAIQRSFSVQFSAEPVPRFPGDPLPGSTQALRKKRADLKQTGASRPEAHQSADGILRGAESKSGSPAVKTAASGEKQSVHPPGKAVAGREAATRTSGLDGLDLPLELPPNEPDAIDVETQVVPDPEDNLQLLEYLTASTPEDDDAMMCQTIRFNIGEFEAGGSIGDLLSGRSRREQNRDPGLYMLHWMEVTENLSLRKQYNEEKLCIIHVNVDNIDDILEQAPDDRKSSLSGDIEKAVRQWATRNQGAFVRINYARSVILCESRNIEINETNKFPILDEVREIPTGVDIPASLSIGIGKGGKTIAQTEEYAIAALELALGRGGDQAVVKRGLNVEYFGGKLPTVEKRNKGRSRIVALALQRLIDQSSRVFIMGHKLPDMDALGAALGVARMAKNRGKETNIVIDSWSAVDMLYKLAVEEGQHRFVMSDYAKLIISRDDLLVVVDTHKPSLAECGELADYVDRLVIIDHHRRGEEFFAHPTLVHIEPYASSAAELVSEMLQYVSEDKKGLTRVEAEGLLAGIAVDTKNFSVKTGVRTFEAATWLRRQGADTIIVRQFFKTDMEMLKEKAGILTNARMLPGNMAISRTRGVYDNVAVLISMAADELLNIRGIRASFVVGETEKGGLRVSARSLGDVNVQRIMERIGGGGTLMQAGAQLNMDPDQAVGLIENVVREYVEEEAEREKQKKKEHKAAGENGANGKEPGRRSRNNGNQARNTGKVSRNTGGKS